MEYAQKYIEIKDIMHYSFLMSQNMNLDLDLVSITSESENMGTLCMFCGSHLELQDG